MAIEIDFERNTGLISVGTHLFKISAYRDGSTDNGPYWAFTCVCQDAGPDQGREASLFLSMSPTSRWKVDAFLDAMLAPAKGGGDGSQFVGKLFRAEITHGEYQGREQVNFQRMFPAEGPAVKNPMPEDVTERRRVRRPTESEEDDSEF